MGTAFETNDKDSGEILLMMKMWLPIIGAGLMTGCALFIMAYLAK
jgi:hypothetical protein